MNAYERAELKAENDGYRNDYQRALAVSQMRREPSNGAAVAARFAKDGLYAVCEEVTVFCRITDAVMGSEVRCLGAYGSVDAALTRCEDAANSDPEARVYIVYPPGKEPKEVFSKDFVSHSPEDASEDVPF